MNRLRLASGLVAFPPTAFGRQGWPSGLSLLSDGQIEAVLLAGAADDCVCAIKTHAIARSLSAYSFSHRRQRREDRSNRVRGSLRADAAGRGISCRPLGGYRIPSRGPCVDQGGSEKTRKSSAPMISEAFLAIDLHRMLGIGRPPPNLFCARRCRPTSSPEEDDVPRRRRQRTFRDVLASCRTLDGGFAERGPAQAFVQIGRRVCCASAGPRSSGPRLAICNEGPARRRTCRI